MRSIFELQTLKSSTDYGIIENEKNNCRKPRRFTLVHVYPIVFTPLKSIRTENPDVLSCFNNYVSELESFISAHNFPIIIFFFYTENSTKKFNT